MEWTPTIGKKWHKTARFGSNTRIKSASLRKLHGAKSKQLRRAEDPAVAKPELALGCCVEKRFRNQWHVGVISNWDEDADDYCTTWRITHEDGDVEDCNWKELKPILCPLEDKKYVRNIIDPCRCAPAMAMRRTVAKTYGGTTCYGEACGFDIDAEKNEQTWQVQHTTDGDISDYNIWKIEILVE